MSPSVTESCHGPTQLEEGHCTGREGRDRQLSGKNCSVAWKSVSTWCSVDRTSECGTVRVTRAQRFFATISVSNIWCFCLFLLSHRALCRLLNHTHTCTHTHTHRHTHTCTQTHTPHTHTCTHTHIYYFRSLKCSLQHLKRSYMFRSYDHPQVVVGLMLCSASLTLHSIRPTTITRLILNTARLTHKNTRHAATTPKLT